MYPYKNPYTRSGRLNVGQPTVDDYYSARTQRNVEGGYVLSPGEPVPPGYAVAETTEDGRQIVVPTSTGQGQQPTEAQASPSGNLLPFVAGAAVVNQADKIPSMGSIIEQSGNLITGGSSAAAAAPVTQVIAEGAAIPEGFTAVGSAAMADGAPGVLITSDAAAMPSGYLLPGVATVAGMYGMHDLFSHGDTTPAGGALQGAASGAGIGAGVGSVVPGVGTAVGAGVGAVAGGLIGLAKGLFGGKKNASQLTRRSVRDGLASIGLFQRTGEDAHAHIQLADGSWFDVERGGPDEANIDPDMRYGAQITAWADPLSLILNGGPGARDGEGSTATTGYLVNAATSNAKNIEEVRNNILAFYGKLGLQEQDVLDGLQQLKDAGALTEEEYQVYVNNTQLLYSGDESRYLDATVGEVSAEIARREQGAQPEAAGARPVAPAQIPADSPIAQSVQQQTRNTIPRAKPNYEELVAKGLYRRGSKAAGGYVNNETDEWVAG